MTQVSRQTVETIKTVVIAVLITAVAAFIGGMHYQNANNARVHAAVVEATTKK